MLKRLLTLFCLAVIVSLPRQNAFALALWDASGNLSNDKLLSMPENGQAAMLSKATHYVCKGKKPYYMGTVRHGVNQGVSFWSLSCEHSAAQFMIIIAPDAAGSTKVIQCNLLHGHAQRCYEKLKE